MTEQKSVRMDGDSRINRYIMECKSTISTVSAISTTGINRYIMECKLHLLSKH